MILAEKILRLRKKNGMSQEELAEKLNVSRQSVSKWESAASIPDIAKILDMAKLFGVTTDYLLKEEMVEEEFSVEEDSGADYPSLSIEEADRFLAASKEQGKKIALAVFMLILAPAFLIGISGLPLFGVQIVEDSAAMIGLVIMFVIAAAAVFLLIMSVIPMREFAYIRSGEFVLAYGVEGVLAEKKKNFYPGFIKNVAIGVVLCVLAPTLLFFDVSDQGQLSAVTLMFLPIAIGVYLFIRGGMIMGAFDHLLKKDKTREEIEKDKREEKLGSIYWPVVIAVYLGWSFLTNDWHITWVVWPVAALLFAAIANAVNIMKK